MKHTDQLFVSAITIVAIIACGGIEVSMAPDAKAQGTDADTSVDVVNPTACECSSEPGPQGPEGPEGQIGPAGPQGERGLRGATGEVGPQGAVGPAGAQGSVGLAGTPGAAGARGPQGDVGPRGFTGLTGAQGAKGDTGEQGPMGPVIEPGSVYYPEVTFTARATQTGNVGSTIRCEPGDTLISGGCQLALPTGVNTLTASVPTGSGGWVCMMYKNSFDEVLLVMRAVCIAQD